MKYSSKLNSLNKNFGEGGPRSYTTVLPKYNIFIIDNVYLERSNMSKELIPPSWSSDLSMQPATGND